MMKRAPALLVALSLGAAALPAEALVTQPNGQVMPRDSMNGEIQLYTLFARRGEALDFRADGNTEPATFSPLCDFSAEVLLQETSSRLAVGWYNVDPAATTPPAPADIHTIVPANSPVGTVITSADIRSDPAYRGGQIGFALIGAQTHYSEQRWNPLCSGCSPPGNWITAVIYASVVTPNAFYVAFEDGPVGATPGSFNNDGDYNDYVYFFSGLTCTGGGEPCDTGLPGVCGPGTTQCTSSGLVCQGLVPSSQESCDGLDNDCNGIADEGDLCQAGFVCDRGRCVESCASGEFACPPDKQCDSRGYCVEPACVEVVCDAGQVCVEGTCRGACDGVACPFPTVCRVGACVDPCRNVVCDGGRVCDAGVCKTSCTCSPCAAGLACETSSGLCREPACVDVTCGPGTHCVGGSCVDSCDGAVCPAGQICMSGVCADDPNAAASGAGGSTGVGLGAGGGGGEPGLSGSGGAGGGAAGSGGGGAAGAAGSSGEDSGCGCRVAGAPRSAGAALALGLLLLALERRRGRGAR